MGTKFNDTAPLLVEPSAVVKLVLALIDTRDWIVPLIDPVPLIEPSANVRPLSGAPVSAALIRLPDDVTVPQYMAPSSSRTSALAVFGHEPDRFECLTQNGCRTLPHASHGCVRRLPCATVVAPAARGEQQGTGQQNGASLDALGISVSWRSSFTG